MNDADMSEGTSKASNRADDVGCDQPLALKKMSSVYIESVRSSALILFIYRGYCIFGEPAVIGIFFHLFF